MKSATITENNGWSCEIKLEGGCRLADLDLAAICPGGTLMTSNEDGESAWVFFDGACDLEAGARVPLKAAYAVKYELSQQRLITHDSAPCVMLHYYYSRSRERR